MSQMDPFCTAWHVVSSQTQLRAATHKHPEQQARGKPSSFTYDRQFEIANARQAQQQQGFTMVWNSKSISRPASPPAAAALIA